MSDFDEASYRETQATEERFVDIERDMTRLEGMLKSLARKVDGDNEIIAMQRDEIKRLRARNTTTENDFVGE